MERHTGQPSPEGAHVTHTPRLSHPGPREAGRVQVAGQSREKGAGFSRCFLSPKLAPPQQASQARFVLCNSTSQLFLKLTFHRATHLPGLWNPLRQQGEWTLFSLGAKGHKPHPDSHHCRGLPLLPCSQFPDATFIPTTPLPPPTWYYLHVGWVLHSPFKSLPKTWFESHLPASPPLCGIVSSIRLHIDTLTTAGERASTMYRSLERGTFQFQGD